MLFGQQPKGENGMAAKGLDLKLIEDIVRLKKLGFTKRKVARCLKIHRNTVTKFWGEEVSLVPVTKEPLPSADAEVESWVNNIDWPKTRDEVLRGVPLSVLHEENFSKIPVTYSAFWKQLQRRAPCLATTMVRVFAPGVRAEIDYCDGIDLVDITTGELIKTEFFVGVLCSSRYTFAEFTLSQKSEDFLTSHVRMFEYFGGVTQVVSPDNLKSAVTKAHRYDPVINPAYTKLASHYGFAVVPARVRTPQDKAIVERTIQIFQRWFFFRVRHKTFTSLVELNLCLKADLELFHQKKHRVFRKTRQEMFNQERESLIKLPDTPYKVATYLKAILSRDCHLKFADNFYSAPHGLRGLELEVWATSTVIEIYHKAERVALHPRSRTQAKFTTNPSHYPPAHQAYHEEDVAKLRERAERGGGETLKLIERLLSGKYPLQYFRRCQGILALGHKYSWPRLEIAAAAANRFNQITTQYLERVIKQGGGTLSKEAGPIARGFNPYLRGIDKILH
jgi:transposase